MIWTLSELAAIFAEAFMITRFMVYYFGYKSQKASLYKSSLLFFCIFFFDCIGTFLIKNEFVFIAGFILSAFLFSIRFLNGHIFEKFLISSISYSLIYVVNLPVLNIISILSNISADELVEIQDSSRIICLFCTKLLYFFATQCVLWVRKKEPYRFRISEWIIVISALNITLIIGFIMYIITRQSAITNYMCLIVTILLSVLNVIIFIFIRKMNISSREKTEKELLRLQLQMQQDEMMILERQYKNICILRHDHHNKISCINTLLSEDKYSDAKKYIQRLLGTDAADIHSYIQSSSSVIDAVVNEKFDKAERKNIEVSCRITVKVPEYLEYDMSVLLANLLDNAIEACEKNTVPSQIILTIIRVAGYYKAVVKNTIQDSVLEKNQHLDSRKENKSEHGWGLKSVKEIAEKHEGMIDIYEKNGMFIVSVLLMKKDFSNMGD